MSDNLILYIRESIKKSGIYYLNGEIPVWADDPLPDHINLNEVISKIERLLPVAYFRYVHAVKIGTYPEMIERQFNALYKDGVLYISNIQADADDMLDDIIHEISHAVEENNYDLIYADERILLEFLRKRKKLYNLLKSQNFNVNIEQFMQVKYDEDFDMLLFEEIGYPILNNLVIGLFPGAYSVTSINEYFATGFQKYYMNESNYIAKICPNLTRKLNYLDELANEY